MDFKVRILNLQNSGLTLGKWIKVAALELSKELTINHEVLLSLISNFSTSDIRLITEEAVNSLTSFDERFADFELTVPKGDPSRNIGSLIRLINKEFGDGALGRSSISDIDYYRPAVKESIIPSGGKRLSVQQQKPGNIMGVFVAVTGGGKSSSAQNTALSDQFGKASFSTTTAVYETKTDGDAEAQLDQYLARSGSAGTFSWISDLTAITIPSGTARIQVILNDPSNDENPNSIPPDGLRFAVEVATDTDQPTVNVVTNEGYLEVTGDEGSVITISSPPTGYSNVSALFTEAVDEGTLVGDQTIQMKIFIRVTTN